VSSQNDALSHGGGIRGSVTSCEIEFKGLQTVDDALRLLRLAERQALRVTMDGSSGTGLSVCVSVSEAGQSVQSMATVLLALALVAGEDGDFLPHAVESAKALEADSLEA
jgi:hypothetical protein